MVLIHDQDGEQMAHIQDHDGEQWQMMIQFVHNASTGHVMT